MSKPHSIINADISRTVTSELLLGLKGFVTFINDGYQRLI